MTFSLDQYKAVRDGAGVVDSSDRGKIAVFGADRIDYLQGLLTNDIGRLVPGTGCYAAFLTPQGRMIAALQVLALDDAILLEVHPEVKDALIEKLQELIFTEDVQITDWTNTLASLGLYGPKSALVLATALASNNSTNNPTVKQIASYEEYGNCRYSVHGTSVIVARINDLGGIGFHLYVEIRLLSRFHKTLLTSGAIDVNSETLEVLRIEVGRPLFKVDMDETTIPLEAGIEDRAISYTKGCYVGQEMIARILHRGQGKVLRKLVGLTFETTILPQRGVLLHSGGREVGWLTSVAFSRNLRKPIALGYVHRDLAVPGSVVEVVHEDHRLTAVITEPPFVRVVPARG